MGQLSISEVLTTVDKLLSSDWNDATTEQKVQIVTALKTCYPVLGIEGMKQWIVRISHLWNISQKAVKLLIVDDHINITLFKQKVKKQPKYLFPKTGFIAEYLKYTVNSEAPETFHFWTAVSILGAVFGRNIVLDLGHFKIYPNHFLMLIAPSGRCKKTSASDIGVELLSQIPTINIIAEKVTPEALLESMKSSDKENKECRGFIYAPELPVFLGKQQYNEGMIDILTRFGDNPNKLDYKTRTQGIINLTDINAAMLACCTPEGLANTLPKSAFGGGFMSRFLFIMMKTTDRELAIPPPRDELLRTSLIEQLKTFHLMKKTFTLSDEGYQWYVKWYSKLKKESAMIDDPKLCGYYERKHVHLLRLTMVLVLAAGDEAVFTVEKFEEALAIFNTIELPMPEAFSDAGDNYLGKAAQKILDQLEKAGSQGITRSVLLKKNLRVVGTAKVLTTVMETLKTAKLVEESLILGTKYYYFKRGG